MKATIQIPAGWRRVTRGVVRKGDMILDIGAMKWRPEPPTNNNLKCFHAVIRRVAAKGAKK